MHFIVFSWSFKLNVHFTVFLITKIFNVVLVSCAAVCLGQDTPAKEILNLNVVFLVK